MMTPKDLLDTMLGYLGFVVQIEETTNEGGNATLQIYTEESRRLIGRDGETLEAIQFLLNRLLQARDKDAEKVIVDCEHYRSMREDRIVQRVRELAERVRITGRSLQLEPMNSYERRLVHNAFKDDPEVATWSPSDSARIKQITLLKRQPKRKQPLKERRFPSQLPLRCAKRRPCHDRSLRVAHSRRLQFPSIVPHPWRFPRALPVAIGIYPAADYLFLPLRRQ